MHEGTVQNEPLSWRSRTYFRPAVMDQGCLSSKSMSLNRSVHGLIEKYFLNLAHPLLSSAHDSSHLSHKSLVFK